MQVNVSLPRLLLQQLVSTAGAAGMSQEEFITVAVAEKLARAEHNAWLAKHMETLSQSAEGGPAK